jgi:organic radical activating enzyme
MVNVKYPFECTWIDYPDNENLAIIIYFMGCEQSCLNCHNTEFKNPKHNKNTRYLDFKSFTEEIEYHSTLYQTNKIVFTGGDPLSSYNMEFVKGYLKVAPVYNKHICIYTSYDISYVRSNNVSGFKFIKCGKYIEELKQKSYKTDELFQLASSNQNIYNSNLELISKLGVLKF